MNGFLLGLTSGTVCLAYCAPVLLPYMLGQENNVRKNTLELILFMLGRLAGYILFAVLAWLTHRMLVKVHAENALVMGFAYFGLAGLLIYSSFRPHPAKCAAEPFRKRIAHLSGGWLPAALGFLAGINLCPPFLLAFTNAVAAQRLGGSILFFISFFTGTLVYFIPLPFLGLLRRNEILGKVGKMAAVIVGAYYGYTGIIMFIGGILQ